MSQFVADVDRVLTRAHGLFPTSGGSAAGVFAANGGGRSVPPVPAGGSGLGSGAAGAGDGYGAARAAVTGLEVQSGGGAGEATAVGQRGALGAGSVRDGARAQADAIGRVAHTAPGMRLMVSAMDERLGAMQRQIEETTAENRVLALRLRQLAAAYQGLRMGGGAGGLSALSAIPAAFSGGSGSGFGGLGALGSLPMSMLGGMGGAGGSSGGLGGLASSLAGRSVGGELPPGVASEKGLQRDTILAARAVAAAFPEIRTIGGVRPDSLKWHPNGQAIDVMIPDPTSPHGKALGDAVMRFAMAHRQQFNINHVIWQQTIHNPDGSSSLMENRGSPTQNHMDHVHIATNGGGFPRGGEVYRL
ncbi:hypothetical protein [Mycobacterium sp. TY815]|uniref:hypothetical protein n=1 Tax=unclassified Mycobacterium TaxID=2642494 RepID=UPI00274034A6|nr:hypothetical protein [Mycobacterium sp. TY815]MDP7707183.1 hypothetical protein [Mycobacterium sp. TY815]